MALAICYSGSNSSQVSRVSTIRTSPTTGGRTKYGGVRGYEIKKSHIDVTFTHDVFSTLRQNRFVLHIQRGTVSPTWQLYILFTSIYCINLLTSPTNAPLLQHRFPLIFPALICIQRAPDWLKTNGILQPALNSSGALQRKVKVFLKFE